MSEHKQANNLMNFVSPREFRYFKGTDNYNILVTNYATDLAKRVGSTCDISDFMEKIFGADWYEVPYQRLYKLAKLTVRKNSFRPTYYPKREENRKSMLLARAGLRRVEWSYDNTIYRICKKYYKASLIDELIKEDTRLGTLRGGYMSVECMLDQLAKIAAVIRKYDKKDIKKLKGVDSLDDLRSIYRENGDILKYTNGFYNGDLKATMTASQLNKLIKEQAEAFVQHRMSKDVDEQAWGVIKEHFTERMAWRYTRANCWHTPTQSTLNGIVRATKEREKVMELERIVKKLGLSLTGGERGNLPYMGWQISKVDSKLCKLVKELERAYDAGTDIDVIKDLAHHRSYAIYRSNYSRSVYTPILLSNHNN